MNRSALALLGGLLLTAGCTVRPPTGPTVLAVPPEGKDLPTLEKVFEEAIEISVAKKTVPKLVLEVIS